MSKKVKKGKRKRSAITAEWRKGLSKKVKRFYQTRGRKLTK